MTREQAQEWLRCRKDKAYWIAKYCKIRDPINGVIPFSLHPFQIKTVRKINASRKSVILKSRQMGLSWLVCADNLHDVLFFSAKLNLMISKREVDAYDLMERIQFIYDHLPDWMKITITERNKGVLALANYSKIESQPTTKDAGRGRPPSKVTVDEYGFCRFGTELLNSAETACSHGGACILLSTANGYGNEFSRIWHGAIRHENNFHPIFLPWFDYPGRTEEWLAEETKGWQVWRIAQEYPSTWEEAFRQTGRPVFDRDSLTPSASVTVPIEFASEEEMYTGLGLDKVEKAPPIADCSHAVIATRDRLSIYQLPRVNGVYLIGADPAEGLIHGDNSAVTILDRENGEQVAEWYGKCSIEEFAYLLFELSQLYHGLLLPERNNHGQAICSLLVSWACPHLYWSKPVWDRQSGKRIKDRKAGWETTSANKTLMIDELAMGLKLRWVRPASPHFLEEADKYETHEDGTYGAPGGMNDDAVMSFAIAWAGRKSLILWEGASTGQGRAALEAPWDV